MKLSRLYTNEPSIFTPISFRDGLNVIVARIYHPLDHANGQHNLGKTLLIDVLDFCLLKKVGSDGNFLKKREDLFGDLVFFLEIETQSGGYLTVRRPVREATLIAFKQHVDRHQDFHNLPDAEWDHVNVSLTASVKLLDSYLELSSIKPWNYRKGFGYFMRGQRDYNDEFRLSKFGLGKDIDWKPYVAKVLGFSGTLLTDKYKADAEYEKIRSQRDELQTETSAKVADYEKIRASITVKQDEVDRKVAELDEFDLHSQETALTQELAEDVEQQIAELNQRLYNARIDLKEVEGGLKDEVHFDLDDVERIFKEAQITFPGQLARDYQDLVEFNRRILTERRGHLQEQSIRLKDEIIFLEQSHIGLSERRRIFLKVLSGTDNLKKYKDLQRQLDFDRANLAVLNERVAKLKQIRDFNEGFRTTRAESDRLSVEIEDVINEGSSRFKEILKAFSRIVNEVLHRTAVVYVKQNDKGNLDFQAEFTDTDTEAPTQEAQGTSFRQILCIAFDLAVLISYARDPFFHFVYHDGGLERLENKRKLALLKVIRETCNNYSIQYVLSSLEEDLPKAEDYDFMCPKPEEIILVLDDSGQKGRLFKTAGF